MGKTNWRLDKSPGFTLAEVMITIAIIGILLGVALPSYQDYLRRSRRADAKITLHNLAAAQETYFFRNNKYAMKFSDIRVVPEAAVTLPSDEGFYAITMVADDFSWSLSASALGLQIADEQCASFTITHLGVNAAFDINGIENAGCW